MNRLIFALTIFSVAAGWGLHAYVWEHRPAMQKVVEMHDRMNDHAVLVAWRIVYCKKPDIVPSAPIKSQITH